MASHSVTGAVVMGGSIATIIALGIPLILGSVSSPGLMAFMPEFPIPDYPFPFPFFLGANSKAEDVTCAPSAYRTEIVSLDPLLIYIHSFLHEAEIDTLLRTAEPLFKPSQVAKHGQKVNTQDRTSSSAGLPFDDRTVECVLDRATSFMGTMLVPGKDEMGPPQLVRYTAGQKFNIHHDWYDTPQWAYDGSRRKFNRVASFFAILQDNCTDGETYFPYIGMGEQHSQQQQQLAEHISRTWNDSDPAWRKHEQGGLAFRPIRGNALFWVNLHTNGSGDGRTMHAGLPVGAGLKTAMNIWPRQFYTVD